MAAATGVLFWVQPSDIRVFAVILGVIGFSLYGPDALMAGAGAIDVGSPKRAVAAAGIINGMGSVGSVLQEVVVGRILNAEQGTGPVFGLLLGSSLAACALMAVLVVRGARGHAAV
jgi:sugar phosphate permease